jgi:hypothetical protein
VSPSLDAFVELPLGRGVRLRLAAVSLLGQPELRDRCSTPRIVAARSTTRSSASGTRDLVPAERFGQLLTRIGVALPCHAALP